MQTTPAPPDPLQLVATGRRVIAIERRSGDVDLNCIRGRLSVIRSTPGQIDPQPIIAVIGQRHRKTVAIQHALVQGRRV